MHRQEVERRGVRSGPLTLIGTEEVVGFEPEALRSALARAGLLDLDSRTPPSPRAAETAGLRTPLSGSIAVANFLDDSVTFLSGKGRGYHSGGRAESSVPVPGHPIALEPCPLGGTLAVVNYEGGSVTFLSLDEGSFAHQTRAASTLTTGPLPLHAHPPHQLS